MEKYKTSLDRIEEVIDKELKTTEENYFNADSCDECSKKIVDSWKEEMEKIIKLKEKFEELKSINKQIENSELEAVEKQAEELSLNEEDDFDMSLCKEGDL